jgi:uncharacterized phiE125 gp8 family phage protein
MPIKVITAPTAEAITRAEAKLHLRVDDVGGVHPDDALIDGLITAAREYAQHYTQRSVGSQVLELALDEFPSDGWIDLTMGPVSAITSVSYVDTAGATQTWASSNYSLDDYSNPARVVLAYGVSWPSTQDIPNAVKVRYTAGAGTVPKATKNAMLLHIDAHYPGNGYTEQQREVIMKAIDSLLNTVKVYGF